MGKGASSSQMRMLGQWLGKWLEDGRDWQGRVCCVVVQVRWWWRSMCRGHCRLLLTTYVYFPTAAVFTALTPPHVQPDPCGTRGATQATYLSPPSPTYAHGFPGSRWLRPGPCSSTEGTMATVTEVVSGSWWAPQCLPSSSRA